MIKNHGNFTLNVNRSFKSTHSSFYLTRIKRTLEFITHLKTNGHIDPAAEGGADGP